MTNDARVVNVPIGEFVDNGLLYHFNSSYFWPLGLFLVAERYEHEAETYREALYPRIRAALDDPAVHDALDAWADRSPMTAEADTLDELAETIWQAFGADLRGVTSEVLRLRSFDPPALVRSALGADQQAEKRRKAAEWITARAAQMKHAEADPT